MSNPTPEVVYDGNIDNFDYSKLKDRQYAAHDYNVDKAHANGPQPARRCTDCLCLIIFMAACGGVLYMSILGYVKGNPDEMLAPVSGGNQICGYGVATGFDYLYIPNIAAAAANPTNLFLYGVCIEKCPSSSSGSYNCLATNQYPSPDTCNNYPIYPTTIFGNYCIPDFNSMTTEVSSAEAAALKTAFDGTGLGGFINDMY